MSFPRYPKYKNSGVEWLGEVPEGWKVARFDGLMRTHRSAIASSTLAGVNVLHYSIPAVQETGFGVFQDGTEIDSNKLLVEEVQLLVSKLNPHKQTMVIARPEPSFVTVASTEFVPLIAEGCSLGYARYVWLSDIALQYLLSRTDSATRSHQRVNPDDISKAVWAWPAPEEQEQIASFLDRETAKIDALIEEQRRLIKLLKEKRQAIIWHAVTKGLEFEGVLKASGVQWIGEVPTHWNVVPLRAMARLESGHTPSRSRPEYWENCEYPWFTLSDVWQIRDGGFEYVSDTSEKVSALGLANSSARLLPKGTVILSRTASVGFAAIMKMNMATSQDFANWICGAELEPRFLLWSFRGMKAEFDRLMMGSTHKTIYMPDIAAFRIAMPNLTQQRKIDGYLTQFTATVSELIESVQGGIETLQERRSALISAAVTGKIDVRQPERKPVASVKPYSSGFAHQLLAAEILARCNDPHMGRTKLQKLIHMTEYHAQIDELRGEYTRQIAGPLDKKAMAGLERGLEKQRWYKTVREGKRYRYLPLDKHEQHSKYLEHWADKQPRIDEVLTLMGSLTMRQCEIVSTLYAAWNDLLIDNFPVTDDGILAQAATAEGWHESKARTPREKWEAALRWMKDKGLVPTGFGAHTRKVHAEVVHEPA